MPRPPTRPRTSPRNSRARACVPPPSRPTRPMPSRLTIWYAKSPRSSAGSISSSILDAGLPLDYGFQFNGEKHFVSDLVASARALFRFRPSSSDTDSSVADNLAWTLTVFAHVTSPGDDAWTNARGDQVRFDIVIDSAMAILDRATHNPCGRENRARLEVESITSFSFALRQMNSTPEE